jgi:Zn-dependent alcohol dehydrogenase
MAAGGESQLRLRLNEEAFPAMKGHEDGGIVLWTGGRKRELSNPP